MSHPLEDRNKALLFMLVSMFFFGLMNNCIRQAAEFMHPMQLLSFRNLFGALLVALWICKSGHPQRLRTVRLKEHIIRCSVGVVAMGCWFYALANMPLNQATALSFTTPIFVTLFAIFLLKEKSTLARIGSVTLGLIGTWIILQPDENTMVQFPAIAALVSAACLAVLSIMLKIMTKSEHPDTISFYNAFISLPISLPLAFYFWEPLSFAGLYWSFIVALVGTIAHLFLVRAFQLGEISLLVPLDFLRLLFTAFFAYFWFQQTLSDMTVIGAAIIILAALWGVSEGNQEIRRRLRRILTFYRD
jgi:drug/metabolite transporter (DMT)-like permease